jgi:hypothetical protein
LRPIGNSSGLWGWVHGEKKKKKEGIEPASFSFFFYKKKNGIKRLAVNLKKKKKTKKHKKAQSLYFPSPVVVKQRKDFSFKNPQFSAKGLVVVNLHLKQKWLN